MSDDVGDDGDTDSDDVVKGTVTTTPVGATSGRTLVETETVSRQDERNAAVPRNQVCLGYCYYQHRLHFPGYERNILFGVNTAPQAVAKTTKVLQARHIDDDVFTNYNMQSQWLEIAIDGEI